MATHALVRSFRSAGFSSVRCLFASLAVLAACAGTAASAFACPPEQPPKNVDGKVVPPQKVVQIALLLDTSNSMDGLISQAKTQLWSVVRRVSQLRSDEQPPVMQIALYEYGNNSISAEVGYVRQISGFTSDLDLISEKLFALSTNGGSEFCGAAIQSSVRDLVWCTNADALKMLVIAGNEPFSQGSVDYRLAVPEATRKGIKVNTIHCGSRDDGVKGGWQDGAVLGNGTFFTIEQDKVISQPRTPHDDDIIRCGTALNSTYISYGDRKDRETSLLRQSAQDANAAAVAPAAAAERAVAKSTANYVNRNWDLVDATEGDKWEILKDLPADNLPEAFKGLSFEQQKAKVLEARAERAKLKARIAELEALRSAHLASLAKAAGTENTLGDALTKAIDEQASGVGLAAPKP